MKQVVAINKKLNNIMKENAGIKDEVEEISQFLTDNNFARANAKFNNDQDDKQHSLRAQNNIIMMTIPDTKIPLIYGMDGNILPMDVLSILLLEE